MTDYNAILDTETDPNAPLKSSLFKRIVANPIALAEGATGAPRVRFAALGTIAAGNSVRSRRDGVRADSGVLLKDFHGFTFLQPGTVRVSGEHRSTSGTTDLKVTRLRGDTTTVLATWSTSSGTFQARTVDATVLPGDRVVIGAQNGSYEVRNLRFAIDDTVEPVLWHGGVDDGVEGNP